MRQIPTGDPPPPGVTGTLANIFQCLANGGAAGASAGPLTLNPIGAMPLYGASLANMDRQGAANIGGQDCEPGGFPTPDTFALALARSRAARGTARLSSPPGPPCPCGSNQGGTPSQGPGDVNNYSMTPCNLNASVCKPFFPPPNPRPCTTCDCPGAPPPPFGPPNGPPPPGAPAPPAGGGGGGAPSPPPSGLSGGGGPTLA